jgi:hypothetical protein
VRGERVVVCRGCVHEEETKNNITNAAVFPGVSLVVEDITINIFNKR